MVGSNLVVKGDISVLTWNHEINFSDILTAVGLLLTAGSVFFAGRSLQRNNRVHNADFLLQLTERYFKDKDVRNFYYKVDWGKYKYKPTRFRLSREEYLLDQLLHSFDEIGETFRLGVLDEKQARLF